jgi:general secretion pathway protein H
MLKSATGLFTDRPGSARRRSTGFSLIELLVVIVILAIMAAMVLLSVAIVRSDDPAQTEAQRLTALLEFVSEEALVQGRDYGVEFFADGYRFLAYDPDGGAWSVIQDEAVLRPREMPPELRLVLAVEGREVVVHPADTARERRRDEIRPHVGIFSSGELTPFELFVVAELFTDAWLLRGRMRGEVELIAPGEVP